MFKNLLLLGSLALFFLSVVIPNSLQGITAGGMILCAVLSVKFIRPSRRLNLLFVLFLLSSLVTVFYIVVGLAQGAEMEAARQTVIVYIVSPFLWILIASGLTSLLDEETFRRWSIIFAILCVASVSLFFYLYLSGGSESVHFFIKEANVDLNDGNVAATIHVYGSLIFLSGGFYAAPGLVRGYVSRILVLTALAIAAITSGRTALMLSIPTGLLIGIILNSRIRAPAGAESKRQSALSILHLGLAVVAILVGASILFEPINIGYIFHNVLGKISTGGGEERSEQFYALMNGIGKTWAMGAGHGVGVDFIRNDDFPWRYELMWVATLLRVGIIGSLIYLLPFLIYIVMFLSQWAHRRVSELDVFMFGGFMAAFIASNTNPYMEGFTFQWMYILPVAYLMSRRGQLAAGGYPR